VTGAGCSRLSRRYFQAKSRGQQRSAPPRIAGASTSDDSVGCTYLIGYYSTSTVAVLGGFLDDGIQRGDWVAVVPREVTWLTRHVVAVAVTLHAA